MSDAARKLAELSPEARRALLASVVAKRGQDTIAPLSHGQRALWFLHQLAPESVAYNVSLGWRIQSDVDAPALERALDALAQRHPALRSTCRIADGTPVQLVHARPAVPFTVMDATAWTDDDIRNAAVSASQQPFDLERGPVWRATFFTRPHDHVLALAFHHIVYDDWSGQLIAAELPALYSTQLGRVTGSLPKPRAEFADYLRWQREVLEGPQGEQLWSYWQKALAGELPVLNLPTTRPRPAAQTFNGSSFMFSIDDELARGIQALARDHRTTPYVVALAAFGVLLHRLSGQDDILIGTPTAGRSRPEFADVVGYFVNPVVLRADLSGDPSFAQFLARAQNDVLGAMQHADFPFALLVERLQPDRDPARSPLFQVAFIWDRLLAREPNEESTDSAAALRLDGFVGGQQGANFDLDLTLFHDGRSLFGSWKFNTDLYDADTVRAFHEHFETLLAGIIADSSQRISAIPLLTESERRRLVIEWNATDVRRTEATLHEKVEEQAARTPEATALAFGDSTLTYRALDARANQLARYLRARGVTSETRVGICMERSIEMVVALLATLKAGGAYVPLDPSYPAERLSFMLEDAEVAVLLAQHRTAHALRGGRAEVVIETIETLAPTLDALPTEPLPRSAGPDQLAYVIFTSGSTGRPKGAMNTHRGVVNRLMWMHEQYGCDASDRVLQKTPFSFDVSVWEFFWPLISGATLVIAPPESHRDPLAVAGLIERHGITTIHFVPPMLQAFVDALAPGRCGSLRRVFCSGEALTVAQQRGFFDKSGIELHNLYGPTEAAVDVTFWRCCDEGDRAVPIGRPVANTQTYILDRRLEPVPVGVEGELFLGGVQVGRGYLNRPAMTADRFVPDPFSRTGGTRLYRTGDRARYRTDGAIEFLGRFDEQVKIRGFRIELGEIEACLSRHAAVGHCAVVARTGPAGDRRLVAYVVPAPNRRGDADELRAWVGQSLPDYMTPSAFVFLDALPLSPNGKLDRRALPEPRTPETPASKFVAPRTATESALAAIWVDVLGVPQVGVHDGFFELGGHSLLATKVLARLRQALDVELPLRAFFERPTVEGLAVAIAQERAALADQAALERLLSEVEGR
jgi:amino acid adenylation domain-containing protein